METTGRENQKRLATTSQQPSPWRGPSEQISFIQMGCEARKLPAAGEIFFLTSAFIELIGQVRSSTPACLDSGTTGRRRFQIHRYPEYFDIHGPPKFGGWSPHFSTENGELLPGAVISANCEFSANLGKKMTAEQM